MPIHLRVQIEANLADPVKLAAVVPEFLRGATSLVEHQAVQNLSGVPFQSKTGSHTIEKRTGKAAASVRAQVPYGAPNRGRIFASAKSQYPGNPDVDYLQILEYGRGEIRPKYTPSMLAGRSDRARLAIPSPGGRMLVSGSGGFRGRTGEYRMVRRIPPMEGKYWMEAAAQAATPEIEELARSLIVGAMESS